MHRLSSSFLLGYHGCQRSVGEKLLAGEAFKPSENGYDWLGKGTYFWESNPRRALEWAQMLYQRKKLSNPGEPSVVGAVIDLGFCLDLLTSSGLKAVQAAYENLRFTALQDLSKRIAADLAGDSSDMETLYVREAMETEPLEDIMQRVVNENMPRNLGGGDLLLRRLDYTVINHLHAMRSKAGQEPFDSVRGVFVEGRSLYQDSGFREKTHIQICVRNPALIKGVFRVPDSEIN